MRREILSILSVILLLGFLLFACNIDLTRSDVRTWTVNDDGPADFHSIQEAVNAAGESDIVSVKSGVYIENVLINKTISIIGEGSTGTVIDGDGAGDVVVIAANGVNFSGFIVRNSGQWEAGIRLLQASNCAVSNCIASNNHVGVILHRSSNNILRENQMFGNDYNFFVDSWESSELVNDVDSSNSVEGKPIYYWIDRHDDEIPQDAGHVVLVNCTNIKVARLNLTRNWYGILLAYTQGSLLINNRIEGNFYGINQWHSSNNIATGNVVVNNDYGIRVHFSINSTVAFNQVINNHYGLTLDQAGNNTLKFNNITGNIVNFRLLGNELRDFLNDMDTSNLVEGKPVYYLLSEHDFTIDSKALIGYLGIINSTNILVSNQDLGGNEQGVLLAYSENSTIEKTNLAGNSIGISILGCHGISITDNNASNNGEGILLSNSESSILTGNTISNNDVSGIRLQNSSRNLLSGNVVLQCAVDGGAGIMLTESSENNTIVENTIFNNGHRSQQISPGIDLSDAGIGNAIYHNNFVNNAIQALPSNLESIWDNGFEGNYWSDYTGLDLNNDGIGETAHVLNTYNVDGYPLKGLFSSFNTSSGLKVEIVSNSTIEAFNYFASNGTINMRLSSMTTDQTFGFCRVCIPHAIMSADDISVVVDSGQTPVLQPNYTLYDNGTHRWIYFAYSHSSSEIDIVDEFSPFLFLPLLMMATLLIVLAYRGKRACKNPQPSPCLI
jgi:parallel beta-helix repeat protein